jgi:beta-lactam-binding protein with PASTA domain
VAVPDVRTFSVEDAAEALREAGLRPADQTERFNAQVETGRVIRTTPRAGAEVEVGTPVAIVVSRGPEPLGAPNLIGRTSADAEAATTAMGLRLNTVIEETDASPPDTVISQQPAPDSPVQTGDTIRVVVAKAASTVAVPELREFTPEDAFNSLIEAGLQAGAQRERFNPRVPAGRVIRTDPPAGTEVARGSTVDYVVSRGPRPVEETPAPEPTDRAEPTLEPTPELPGDGRPQTPPDTTELVDQVVRQVPAVRGLEAGQDVEYRFITPQEFRREFRRRFDQENPPDRVAAEEQMLKRLGLLPADADLRQLVIRLYQSQVAAYYDPDTDSMTIIQRDGELGPEDKVFVAHEYGHALQDQHFDLDSLEVSNPTQADRALARLALIEGDASALMLEWALQNLDADELAATGSSTSPADQELLNSMPPILRRQLEFPYLDGFLFVNALRGTGGWQTVNQAYGDPPASTEQVMHPELYPSERPTRVNLPDIAGALGNGWTESFSQTMGEAQTGVWLADGQGGAGLSGLQLPNAAAAAGWGGDRLVSLDGPNGSWAVVWQTDWDSQADADEFAAAADAAMGDLGRAHVVLPGADASGGLDAPVMVLIASDRDALRSVREAAGVAE